MPPSVHVKVNEGTEVEVKYYTGENYTWINFEGIEGVSLIIWGYSLKSVRLTLEKLRYQLDSYLRREANC